MAGSDLVLLLQTGTRQAIHQALSLALLACADGPPTRVVVALFYDGLAAWCDEAQSGGLGNGAGFGAGPTGDRLRAGFSRLGIQGAGVMLDECRGLGGDRFKVVACGGSVEALGLDIDTLLGLEAGRWFDDVVGLPTIWRWASRGRVIGV